MNKLKYKKPMTFQQKIDEYFDAVPEKAVPIFENLLEYLRMSPKTWEAYLNYEGRECKNAREVNENEARLEIADICRKTQNRFAACLIEAAMNDPRKTGMCAFLLKQAHNGGYVDKVSEGRGEAKVVVELKGVGGEEAFK